MNGCQILIGLSIIAAAVWFSIHTIALYKLKQKKCDLEIMKELENEKDKAIAASMEIRNRNEIALLEKKNKLEIEMLTVKQELIEQNAKFEKSLGE